MADAMGNYSLSDLSAVLGGREGMFGNTGGGSWIVMLLIFFLFFRNGNSWGGDFGNVFSNVATPAATQESVRSILEGQSSDRILQGLNGNREAIAQLSQATGIGFEQMQNALCGVKTAIIETANATNLSVKDLSTQLAMGNANIVSTLQSTCSQLGVQMLNGFNAQNIQMLQGFNGIDKTLCDIRYANEKNTSAIIASGTANTERILDYLNQTKLDELNRELALARAEISQKDQTAAIVAQLKGRWGCNTCSCGCN